MLLGFRSIALASLLIFGIACSAQDENLPKAADYQRPSDWHCIDQHLQEAIDLNKARRPLYSALTQGKSEAISDELIQSEELTLKSIGGLLNLAVAWWVKDVPIVCKEYIPMSRSPAFSESFLSPLPSEKPNWIAPVSTMFALQWAYIFHGRKRLIEVAREEFHKLHLPDHYQCMSKHILESIIAAASAADELEALSQAKGAPDPWWINILTVQSHILYVYIGAKVDRMSEELHQQGIPIICHDVPSIPI